MCHNLRQLETDEQSYMSLLPNSWPKEFNFVVKIMILTAFT